MLNEFIEISKKAQETAKLMQTQIAEMDNLMQKVLINAPDKDKGKISEIQALMQRTFNLAKEGKLEDAQNEVKKFENQVK